MMFRMSRDIDKDWDFAVKALEPAFCRTFQVDKVQDYYEPLKASHAQLWIAEGLGAVITSVEAGSNGKLLAVRFIGGSKLKKWADLMEISLTNFARLTGCKQIEAVTRPGFSRLIKSFKPQGLDLFIKVV